MDHKEFSSGGPEFSPVPGEFSSAREFSQPAPEFTPAPPEIDRSGSEFHGDSTSAPEKKKKRRRAVSPLMLTTAAVMVAAVAVLPFSSKPSGRPIWGLPNMELSAQSKAYLDEVWAAMPDGDMDQLIGLFTDPRLSAMSRDEVAPFQEQLGSLPYDSHSESDCRWCSSSEEFAFMEGFHRYPLFYDGEYVRATSLHMDDGYLFMDYWAFAEAEAPEAVHRDMHVQLMGPISNEDTYQSYQATYTHSHDGDGSVYSTFYYEDALTRIVRQEGITLDVLESGRTVSCAQYESADGSGGISTSVTEVRGEFAIEITPSDLPDTSLYFCNYLENGTITIHQTNSNYPDRDYTLEIQVIDGIVQRTDEMAVEQETSSGYYNLLIKMMVETIDGDYYEEYVYSVRAETEEELFHASNWEIAGNNYFA